MTKHIPERPHVGRTLEDFSSNRPMISQIFWVNWSAEYGRYESLTETKTCTETLLLYPVSARTLRP